MLAIERRNEILEKLQTDRRVVVSELSQIYEVSEETIRRDLDKLVNDGYAIKSYGGAVINENMNIDLPFNIRKNRNVIGKQRIAELVAKIVQDGDSIMLDASSTAVYIAKGLKDKKNLTLITNSMEIVIELWICQIGGYYLPAEYQERDRLPLWEPRRTGCFSRIMQTKQLFRAKAWIWQQDLQILMNFLQITNEQCWKMPRSASLQLTAVSLGQQPL